MYIEGVQSHTPIENSYFIHCSASYGHCVAYAPSSPPQNNLFSNCWGYGENTPFVSYNSGSTWVGVSDVNDKRYLRKATEAEYEAYKKEDEKSNEVCGVKEEECSRIVTITMLTHMMKMKE